MPQPDPELWNRARRVRDKLADQYLGHPDVSLVGIGRALDSESTAPTERIVVRVHVRRSLTREALGLPEEIDGIPVCMVAGDYKLE
jgi:hypothetical protein